MEMLAARDKGYMMSRGSQARAKVTAHSARAHDGDSFSHHSQPTETNC